jgi:hypothetical protein
MSRRKGSSPQFVMHTIEMLESAAYRVMSASGHRILARIEIEHGHHGGKENGRLPVTFDNFEDYGISPKSVAPGLREVQALGFVKITTRGRASKSDFGRHPNQFSLTYLRGPAPKYAEPTHEWKQYQTVEDALSVARDARAAKDERAVARSRARTKKSCARGQKITPRPIPSRGQKMTLQCWGQKMTLLSIFSVGRTMQHDRQSGPTRLP